MRFLRTSAAVFAALTLVPAAHARTRNHVMCYKAGTEFAGTSINLDDVDSVTDPGGEHTFLVKGAKDLCIPSKADTDNILEPQAPWVLYAAKRAGGQCNDDLSLACKGDDDCPTGTCQVYTSKFDKADPRNQSVRVRASQVDTRLNFTKEMGVLVPSALGMSPPVAGEHDYFKCYGVKATKASCVGGTSPGEICKEDIDCGMGGVCTANPKLTDTPIDMVVNDNLDGSMDATPLGGQTTQQFKKVKMVCQAAQPDDSPTVHEGTAIMCYSLKQTAGGEFNPVLPQVTNDFGGPSTFEAKKRDMFCSPACIGDETPPPAFTSYVLKASTLAIGADGHPGNGVDVDNDPMTCAPAGGGGCSGGIDNALAAIAGLANSSLADAVNGGSINLLFEIRNFENGFQQVAGYIADLATPAGCTNSNDAAQTCNYVVNSISLAPGDLCVQESLISLPITVAGVDTPPNATANGDGGEGSTFAIALALGGFEFQLALQNVKINLNLVHNGSDVESGSGVLGGGIPVASLRSAIASIQGSCVGGTNAGAACSDDAECNSANCELISGFSPVEIAGLVNSLLATDIDLDGNSNCQPGTVGVNNFEVCTSAADCPDPAQSCSPAESISVGLVFNLIDAEIVGVD